MDLPKHQPKLSKPYTSFDEGGVPLPIEGDSLISEQVVRKSALPQPIKTTRTEEGFNAFDDGDKVEQGASDSIG